MSKVEIVSKIAEASGLTMDAAEKTLDVTIQVIMDTLSQGNMVSLVGFGNFGVKKRKARKVRNPQTGQEMMTQAKVVPYFKAGKGLKEQVDSSH